jgi:transcriptional regulator with PAS, ATPase and Fis domain
MPKKHVKVNEHPKVLELQSKQHALDQQRRQSQAHLAQLREGQKSEDVVAKLMKDPAARLRDPSFAETQLELKTRIEHLTEGIQRYTEQIQEAKKEAMKEILADAIPERKKLIAKTGKLLKQLEEVHEQSFLHNEVLHRLGVEHSLPDAIFFPELNGIPRCPHVNNWNKPIERWFSHMKERGFIK